MATEVKLGLGAVLTLCGLLASGVAASYLTFQTKGEATVQHEMAASDREKGDLQTRLDLVKVKIARLTDIAELRALTPEEAIELKSLESERDILLKRLTDLG